MITVLLLGNIFCTHHEVCDKGLVMCHGLMESPFCSVGLVVSHQSPILAEALTVTLPVYRAGKRFLGAVRFFGQSTDSTPLLPQLCYPRSILARDGSSLGSQLDI
jgi:hypothetical protein